MMDLRGECGLTFAVGPLLPHAVHHGPRVLKDRITFTHGSPVQAPRDQSLQGQVNSPGAACTGAPACFHAVLACYLVAPACFHAVLAYFLGAHANLPVAPACCPSHSCLARCRVSWVGAPSSHPAGPSCSPEAASCPPEVGDPEDPSLEEGGPSCHHGAPASLWVPYREALGGPYFSADLGVSAYLGALACLGVPSWAPGETEVQKVAPSVQGA